MAWRFQLKASAIGAATNRHSLLSSDLCLLAMEVGIEFAGLDVFLALHSFMRCDVDSSARRLCRLKAIFASAHILTGISILLTLIG